MEIIAAFLFAAPPPFLITLVIQLFCNKSEHKVVRHGSLFYTLLILLASLFCLVALGLNPDESFISIGVFCIGILAALASLLGYGLARLIYKIKTEQ